MHNDYSISDVGLFPTSVHTNEAFPPLIEREKRNSKRDQRTSKIGAQQLNSDQPQLIDPSKGVQVTVSNSPVKPGIVNAITRFFYRHFGSITLENQQKAQTIGILSRKLRANITTLSQLSQQAKQIENTFAGQRPSTASYKANSKMVEKARTALQQAKNNLQELKKHEQIAQELANAHSTYDHLPKEMIDLEQQITYAEGHFQLATQLLSFERALTNYGQGKTPQEKWGEFVQVCSSYYEFSQLLKGVTLKDPFVQEYRETQTYSKQTTNENLQRLLQRAYPNLVQKTQRLLEFASEIHLKRMENLKNKLQGVEGLLANYHAHIKDANRLEGWLTATSVIAKIYRLFISRKVLHTQLALVKTKIKTTVSQLQQNAVFIPEEVEWLKTLSQNKQDYQSLQTRIHSIQSQIPLIEHQLVTNDRMDSLIAKLFDYKNVLFFNNNKGIETLKAEIKKSIEKDALLLNSHLETIEIRVSLPPNFKNLDVFSQFKILIPLFHPSLQAKTDHLVRWVKKTRMNRALSKNLSAKTKTAKTKKSKFKKSHGVSPRTHQQELLPSTPLSSSLPLPPASPPVASLLLPISQPTEVIAAPSFVVREPERALDPIPNPIIPIGKKKVLKLTTHQPSAPELLVRAVQQISPIVPLPNTSIAAIKSAGNITTHIPAPQSPSPLLPIQESEFVADDNVPEDNVPIAPPLDFLPPLPLFTEITDIPVAPPLDYYPSTPLNNPVLTTSQPSMSLEKNIHLPIIDQGRNDLFNQIKQRKQLKPIASPASSPISSDKNPPPLQVALAQAMNQYRTRVQPDEDEVEDEVEAREFID